MPAVLFVCMGNICRSPTAEGVFRERVRQAGLADVIHTDSAGTHEYHIGKQPDARSQAEARARGIDVSDLRARQVDRHDFEFFDYLLAMDEANHDWLVAEAPSSLRPRIQPFLKFAPDVPERWVPDPYFGGDAGFRHVFDLVEAAADGLFEAICREHALEVR